MYVGVLSIGNRYAARVVGLAAPLSIGGRYAARGMPQPALTIDRTPLRGYLYEYTVRHDARIDHPRQSHPNPIRRKSTRRDDLAQFALRLARP